MDQTIFLNKENTTLREYISIYDEHSISTFMQYCKEQNLTTLRTLNAIKPFTVLNIFTSPLWEFE